MKISRHIYPSFVFFFLFISVANAQINLSTIFGVEGTTNEEQGEAIACILGFDGENAAYPAVGASGVLSGEGRISVYRTDSSTLFNANGNGTGYELGTSVTQIYRLEANDTYRELVVGMPGSNSVQLFCSYAPSADSKVLDPTLINTFVYSLQELGDTVEGLLDRPVLAVADPKYASSSCSGVNCGGILIFEIGGACTGTPTDPAINNLLTYEATDDSAFVGSSLTRIADINGESNEDFIAGAPGYANDTGAIYYFMSDFSGSGSYSAAGPLTGNAVGEMFGNDVANIEDLNGDGIEDFIVGAPGANSQTGLVRVYSGASVASNPAGPTVLCSVAGQSAGDQFGWTVKGVGDIDGNGEPDFAVGAPGVSSSNGMVYVYSYVSGNTTCQLVATASHPSPVTNERFGISIGALNASEGFCDINSDGQADFCVGSVSGFDSSGSFYCFAGQPAPTPTPTSTPQPTETPTPILTPTPTPVPVGNKTVKKVKPQAPVLEVEGEDDETLASLEVEMQLFGLKVSGASLELVPLKEASVITTAAAKKIRYLATLRGTLNKKYKGRKRIKRSRLSKRNETTFRKLRPGTYRVSYQVKIVRGSGSNRSVVGSSKSSPTTKVSVTLPGK